MAIRLGLDFGTSNTAAAVAVNGQARIIRLEGGRETVPTAIFLDYARRQMVFGQAAVTALTDGREGRFMRALKRVLGTPLMREKRQLLNRRMTLMELVSGFLADIRRQAEAATGSPVTTVLSGRPVHFHAADPLLDRQAELDLAECYKMAGFTDVAFLFEPEAAAIADGAPDLGGKLGLVVDIGGGTSDFTVFGTARGRVQVHASHGLRIGGTDLDRALSLLHVMPLLGMGSELRAAFGPATHTAPVGLFHDLATWEKIAFLYTADTRRAAAEMARMAVSPDRFARLVEVLDMELGHEVAFAVERGKIGATGSGGVIDLGLVERGLAVRLAPADLVRDLAPFGERIRQGALATLAEAGVGPADLGRVVFVGGSSLLGVVQGPIRALCPQAQMVQAGAFSAVAEGLALAAA